MVPKGITLLFFRSFSRSSSDYRFKYDVVYVRYVVLRDFEKGKGDESKVVKTIVVNDETHATLKDEGEMGDSFDDVIQKLIRCCREAKKRNE